MLIYSTFSGAVRCGKDAADGSLLPVVFLMSVCVRESQEWCRFCVFNDEFECREDSLRVNQSGLSPCLVGRGVCGCVFQKQLLRNINTCVSITDVVGD